jgi:hypothetical protein
VKELDLIQRRVWPPDLQLSPEQAAELLRDELAQRGIAADLHAGYGMALLSVCTGLVVWSDGRWFRWAVGRSRRGRIRYAFAQCSDMVTAARRVTMRYEALCPLEPNSPPPSGWPV